MFNNRSCKYFCGRIIHLNVNDFILIRCENGDPESLDNCDVVQIIHLYEVENPGQFCDKYRAIIKWFAR